jgi:hypothetical protein
VDMSFSTLPQSTIDLKLNVIDNNEANYKFIFDNVPAFKRDYNPPLSSAIPLETNVIDYSNTTFECCRHEGILLANNQSWWSSGYSNASSLKLPSGYEMRLYAYGQPQKAEFWFPDSPQYYGTKGVWKPFGNSTYDPATGILTAQLNPNDSIYHLIRNTPLYFDSNTVPEVPSDKPYRVIVAGFLVPKYANIFYEDVSAPPPDNIDISLINAVGRNRSPNTDENYDSRLSGGYIAAIAVISIGFVVLASINILFCRESRL